MRFELLRPLSPETIESTRRTFQPFSKEPLSDEDCRECHRNFMDVMHTLLEIQHDLDRRRAEAGDEVPDRDRVETDEGVQKS